MSQGLTMCEHLVRDTWVRLILRTSVLTCSRVGTLGRPWPCGGLYLTTISNHKTSFLHFERKVHCWIGRKCTWAFYRDRTAWTSVCVCVFMCVYVCVSVCRRLSQVESGDCINTRPPSWRVWGVTVAHGSEVAGHAQGSQAVVSPEAACGQGPKHHSLLRSVHLN